MIIQKIPLSQAQHYQPTSAFVFSLDTAARAAGAEMAIAFQSVTPVIGYL
jgi:hypothetical protein